MKRTTILQVVDGGYSSVLCKLSEAVVIVLEVSNPSKPTEEGLVKQPYPQLSFVMRRSDSSSVAIAGGIFFRFATEKRASKKSLLGGVLAGPGPVQGNVALHQEIDGKRVCVEIDCEAEAGDIGGCGGRQQVIQIMHHLYGNLNVVTINGSYEDINSMKLVMELYDGDHIFDRIVKRGHFREHKAADLTRTIVGVVEACHSLGVMHWDLKLENFLFCNKSEDSPLKSMDFGLSIFFKPCWLVVF